MPLNPVSELPPAVPTFEADHNREWTLIGQKESYIVQLQAELLSRATQANDLHDELLRLQAQHNTLTDVLRRILVEPEDMATVSQAEALLAEVTE